MPAYSIKPSLDKIPAKSFQSWWFWQATNTKSMKQVWSEQQEHETKLRLSGVICPLRGSYHAEDNQWALEVCLTSQNGCLEETAWQEHAVCLGVYNASLISSGNVLGALVLARMFIQNKGHRVTELLKFTTSTRCYERIYSFTNSSVTLDWRKNIPWRQWCGSALVFISV